MWPDLQKLQQSQWFDSSQQASVLLSFSDRFFAAIFSQSDRLHLEFVRLAAENINDVSHSKFSVRAVCRAMMSDKGNQIWH